MRPRARSNRPSFDDSMITGVARKLGILLDQRTGLVAVQARHQDVAKDHMRLVIVDLCQRVEAVFRQHHLGTGLQQKYLGGLADGVRIVDHHYLDAGELRCLAHITPSRINASNRGSTSRRKLSPSPVAAKAFAIHPPARMLSNFFS
jgi:hypothetical protein